MFKKILALSLSVIMVFSMFGIIAVTAYDEDDWDDVYCAYEETCDAFRLVVAVHDDYVDGGCPKSDLDEAVAEYKKASAEFTKAYNKLSSSDKQYFSYERDRIKLYDKIVSDPLKYVPSFKSFEKMDIYYWRLPYNIADYTEFECYFAKLYIALYDAQKTALTVLEWNLFEAVYSLPDSTELKVIRSAAAKNVPDSVKDFIDIAEGFSELTWMFDDYFNACMFMDPSDPKYADVYAELLSAKDDLLVAINDVKTAYNALSAAAKESEYVYWILDGIKIYDYLCNNLETVFPLLRTFVAKLEAYLDADWMFYDLFFELVYGDLSQSQYNKIYAELLNAKVDLLASIDELFDAIDELPDFFISDWIEWIIEDAKFNIKVCNNLDIYLKSYLKFVEIWMIDDTLPYYYDDMLGDYVYDFDYFSRQDFLNMTQLLMRFDMLSPIEKELCMPDAWISQLRKYDRGDITNDGKVNGMDLMYLKKHILGVPGGTLTGDTAIQADLNFDGNINGLDLLAMKKRILGILSPIVYPDWYDTFSFESMPKNKSAGFSPKTTTENEFFTQLKKNAVTLQSEHKAFFLNAK